MQESERTSEAQLGDVIADRYRIDAVLGMGGAGVLYRARHVRTGRDVALKMLNGRAHDAQVAALRLEREALAAVSVRHPNVVEVLDLGEDRQGRPFLVLELLTGTTLHERLERGGALSPQAMFELALPLLGVLALAHERGLLHRDVKPGNVFLSAAPDGACVPKLLDFGIAKVEGGAALTQPGRLIGTEGYMAPEHVQGGELSPASDLWSLGALLYTCLVGRAPFPAEAMRAASAPPFPRHRLVAPGAIALLLVIERALEWSPRARYADARSFARALLAVAHQKGLAIPAAPDPIGLPAWRAWCSELRAQPQALELTHAPVAERSPLGPSLAAQAQTDVHASPWPHVGQVLAGRFELRRALGRGAMGAVYEALDRTTSTLVALKVLHRLEPNAIYRLKREFRALTDVAHPNLVALHELFGDEAGRFFFTMDLVHGVDFREYVRAGGALDEARLRSALVQLVHGVRHLHALGKLHRDLKPSNVLVKADGALSIVDFGLAHSLTDPAAQHTEHELQGTPLYAAPEQIDPSALAPAIDWYAVGVMVYEALTGQLPFEGGSHRVMMDKTRDSAPPPSSRVAHVLPRALERICTRLLKRDPEERADGRDVLAALDASAVEAAPDTSFVFAGRQAELAQLMSAFRSARSGELSAVFIEAPSGMGKTTLATRFLRELIERERALVLCGRCYAQEALHYKAFDGVIDALSAYLRQLSGETGEALLPADAAALAQLFPVLRRAPPIARAAFAVPPIDPLGLRTRAFNALRELLASVARHTPLAIFVDDLQWGDIDSARLLRELLAAPPIPGLLFVAAFRSEARESSPLFGELFRDGGPGTATLHIELGPLTAASIAELAESALPGRAASAQIAHRSDGHPMLARELIRFAREQGDVTQLDAVSLEAAIAAQVARLTPAAGTLFEVICLAGARLPRSVLVELSPEAHVGALRELRLANAVRETVHDDELHIEPYHDRVREIVVAGIEPARAQAIHAALAGALRTRGDDALEMVVHHSVEAGRGVEAVHLAERAAERATAALAFERATDLLALALRLSGVPSEQQRLRLALADACVRAGRAAAAADGYVLASEGLPHTPARFELRQRAMTQYFVGGHAERGTALLHELARELGVGLGNALEERSIPGMLRLVISLLLLTFFGWPRLRRAPDAAASPALAQLRLLWSAAAPLLQVKSSDSTILAWRAHGLAARLGEPVIYAQALALRMTLLAFLTGARWRSLDKRIAHARALVDGTGAPWDRQFLSVMQGAQALLFGEFDRALEASMHAATSVESRTPFALAVQSTARAVVLPALYWRGFVGKTAELSQAWIQAAQAAGDRHLEVNFRIVGAHRFLRGDDVARARAEIQLARNVRIDYVHPAFSAPWWEASVALYAGDPREALATCERMREVFERNYNAAAGYVTMWALTVGASANAVLLREPNDRFARAQLRASLRSLRWRRSALRAAALPHLQGTVALREGHRTRALALLDNAVVAYDALGMRLWSASLRWSLAKLGHPHAAALERSALEVFTAEGIASPEHWSRMLAPGLT